MTEDADSSGSAPRGHLRLRQALQRSVGDVIPVASEPEQRIERPVTNNAMRRVSALCSGLLMFVMFIPGGQGHELVPPWQQLFMPGSTTFVAAIFGFFLLSLQFRPMDAYTRARWFAIVGALLLSFGFFVADASVSGDQFSGQPAIAALFAGGIAPAIALTLGVVPMLGALFWRVQDQESRAPKLALCVGAFLCTFMYLAGHLVGLATEVPLVLGLEAMENAAFLGDRVAAGLALLPLVLCALTPLSLIEWRGGPRIHVFAAMAYWAAVALPGVVLALFVATSDWWFWVLEPLKVILTLAAGLLLLSLGLGHLMASIDQNKAV